MDGRVCNEAVAFRSWLLGQRVEGCRSPEAARRRVLPKGRGVPERKQTVLSMISFPHLPRAIEAKTGKADQKRQVMCDECG